MKKGSAKGRGHGHGRGGSGTSRVQAPSQSMAAAEGQVDLRSSNIPQFLNQLGAGRRTLLRPEHQEMVVKWVTDNASSQMSSTTHLSTESSLVSSQESGIPKPSCDPPFSQPAQCSKKIDVTFAHSHELFSGPFTALQMQESQELPEDFICTDAQSLEYPPSPGDVVVEERHPPGDIGRDDDDDETQLASGESMGLSVGQEEDRSDGVEEEAVDDLVNDPNWPGESSSGESSGVTEAHAAPLTASRGRGVSRGRGHLIERRQARGSRAEARLSPPHQAPTSRGRVSLVWTFFNVCADDKRSAVCSLCHSKISRGSQKSNLTTSGMRRHLEGKHWAEWQRVNAGQAASGVPAAASSSRLSAASPVRMTRQDTETSASVPVTSQPSISASPLPVSAPSSAASFASCQQLSIVQAFERKRKYAASHPQAQALNSHISKMLALEMLSFRLVESRSFRDLMAAAAPRYSVPSRHYFSRRAVPDLHHHVSSNIQRALRYSVSDKVHLTTDSWTSACGQGRYISLTAHWVNVVAAGTKSQTGMDYLRPPHKIAGTGSANPTSSSTSSSSSSSALTSSSASGWKRCSTGVGRRQQAVLKLLSLGDRQHSAREVLNGIMQETERWLSPLQLGPGMVVCDNGRNLVAALELGELTHVPCLAHVFNLVVQRFLKTYPNLQELLVKVRRLCAHFRKSTVAAASLRKIQQRLHLPQHRLMCDVTTRWNSTYYMLSRVCEQQRALMEYQLQNPRVPTSQLPQFASHDWAWMADICEVLRIFEDSTKRVSCDDAIVSVTIPLLCVIKESLLSIKQSELCVEEAGIAEDVVEHDTESTLLSASQKQWQEEDEDDDDMEEDVEEEGAHTFEGSTHVGCVPSVRRGWGEEEEEEWDNHPSDGESPLIVHSLAHMSDFMLDCFARDQRVVRIMDSSRYWIFALLDPRYKDQVCSLIPLEERTHRLNKYKLELLQTMMEIFPPTIAGGREESSCGNVTTSAKSTAKKGTLSKVWENLMAPQRQTSSTEVPPTSRREKYRRMLREYMADRNPVLPDPSAPYTYWVSKLDTWLELSQYALEVLACPAASVLSERVFSAAGGIITDKRSRLSTESADRLTLIKMNNNWIEPDFQTSPPPEQSCQK